MAYNRKETLRGNIEAIRIAFDREKTGRSLTQPEIEILRSYKGFGALKCILREGPKNEWPTTDRHLYEDVQQLFAVLKENTRDEQEYRDMVLSLKASVLSAFYTRKEITDVISSAIKERGINVTRFLDPSSGNGVFINSFVKDHPQAEVVAYEKDLLTGKILSALHSQSEIHVEGFEKIEDDRIGYFDAVSSNIPFGDFGVADVRYATSKNPIYRQSSKTIHNYFFLKALDVVREGGIVAFITSQGVMNSASPFVRMELMKRSDLVAALRLPNNTFSENAGTDAGSDLIILQKHTGKKSLSADEEFFIQSVVDRQTNVPDNKFYQAFPRYVICTDATMGKDQYGKPAINYIHKDGIEGIAKDVKVALDESLRLRLNMERYKTNGIMPTLDPVKRENINIKQKITDNFQGKTPHEPLKFNIEGYGDYVVQLESGRLTATSERTKESFALADNEKAHTVGFYTNNINDMVARAICRQLDGAVLLSEEREPLYDEDPYGNEVERGTVSAERWDLSGVFQRLYEKVEEQPKEEMIPDTLMQTFLEQKNKYPDAVVILRNTETYEILGIDAIDANRILGLPMNSGKSEEESLPIIKFPMTDLDSNLPKLVRAGMRVVIAENHDRETGQGMTEKGALSTEPVPETRTEEKPGTAQEVNQPSKRRTRGKTKSIPVGQSLLFPDTPDDLSSRAFTEALRFFHKEGSMVVENGVVGTLTDIRGNKAIFTPLDFDSEQNERAMLYVTISETYQELYRYEAETLEESTHLREHLNDYYDEFVKKYGNLNAKDNVKFILMDANGRESLTLERSENGQFVKADIFAQPVSFSVEEEALAETPLEALSPCRSISMEKSILTTCHRL